MGGWIVSKDWVEDVLEFHRRFAPEVIRGEPGEPYGREAAHYALGFIVEELDETGHAMRAGDVAAVADGLTDLIYVTIRAAIIWGVDLRPIWDAVHESNLAKIDGRKREDTKWEKAANWIAPDLEAILENQTPLA